MRAVLFDLDGTLSESAPSILSSLHAAFDELGLPRLDPLVEQTLIGPPFAVSLPPLIGAERTPQVVAAYRRHYTGGGMFHTRAYDGVPELLAELRAAGVTLAVATSKPEEYAVPIVAHLGLSEAFGAICGDTLDGARPTKTEVIAGALERLGLDDPGQAVMVGDRSHDVLGARANGLDCLGAGWGYGLPGELEAAGAVSVHATVADLRPALLAVAAAGRS